MVGAKLGVALSKSPTVASQVLQVYGIGAGVGVALSFGRAQETEADRVGLILMAKAGYDPRVAMEVWERMKKKIAANKRRRSFYPDFRRKKTSSPSMAVAGRVKCPFATDFQRDQEAPAAFCQAMPTLGVATAPRL